MIFRSKLSSRLSSKTGKLYAQFIRYFLVGGTAFVVDISLLYILTDFAKIFYIASASISFMAGMLVNYVLSVAWVFNYRSIKNKSDEFSIFFAIGIIGLILNAILINSLTEWGNFYYLESKVAAAVVILFFNFSTRKFFLFSELFHEKPKPDNVQ